MSLADKLVARTAKLFPPALIAAIRDGMVPGRSAVLATARHLNRDLVRNHSAPVARRLAVRLAHRALIGTQT